MSVPPMSEIGEDKVGETVDEKVVDEQATALPKDQKIGGASFWLVMIFLCITTFLSALDLTAVSTALPTIANDLHIEQFAWLGATYALASTAFLPLFAALSSIFGRRPLLVAAILFFAAGSAMCGAAQSQSVIFAGRTIQGVGGGGILALAEILVSDMVPLNKRGVYQGIFGAVWSISSAIGPPVGGVLAQNNWRWLFYLNLPLSGISLVLVTLFLNFKTPTQTFKAQFGRIDWIGSFLFVTATTAIVLGLVWGGSVYKWKSVPVLVPLLCGVFGLAAFFVVEWLWIAEPIVPRDVLQNRTTILGYIETFLHGAAVMLIVYYFPTFFQVVKGTTATQSGVQMFTLCFTIAPFAIVCGVWITISKSYRLPNSVGFALSILGFGLMCLINADSGHSIYSSVPIILGIGLGLLYTATVFPVLAPLDVALSAHALGFHGFTRSFGQTIGVTIGATVLQNGLEHKLPASFINLVYQNTNSSNLVYATLPTINTIDDVNLRDLVRIGYADSLHYIYITGIAIAAVGLLATALLKEIPMATQTDERFAFEERRKKQPSVPV